MPNIKLTTHTHGSKLFFVFVFQTSGVFSTFLEGREGPGEYNSCIQTGHDYFLGSLILIQRLFFCTFIFQH